MRHLLQVVVGLGVGGLACACGGSSPALNQQVEQRVTVMEAAQRSCYEQSETGRAGLPSQGRVVWESSALGTPVHIEAETEPDDPQLERCYEQVLKSEKFPAGYPELGYSMRVDQTPAPSVPARVIAPSEFGSLPPDEDAE